MKRPLLFLVFAPWHAVIVAAVTVLAPVDVLDRWPLIRALMQPVLKTFPTLVENAAYYAHPQVATLTFSFLLAMFVASTVVSLLACALLLTLAERDGTRQKKRLSAKEYRLVFALFLVGVGSLLAHIFVDPTAGIGSGIVRRDRWALALVHFMAMWVAAVSVSMLWMSLMMLIRDRSVSTKERK